MFERSGEHRPARLQFEGAIRTDKLQSRQVEEERGILKGPEGETSIVGTADYEFFVCPAILYQM